MPNLDPKFIDTATREMRSHGIDGWLLYDFRARNQIAADLIGLPEGQKRRYFVLVKPGIEPVALGQRSEIPGWDGWPYELRRYVSWKDLEDNLRALLDKVVKIFWIDRCELFC